MGPFALRTVGRALAVGITMTFGGALLASAGSSRGDPARGAEVYQTKCGGCHSLDSNRVGPLHRGVVGRRAGSAPGFHYSKALSASRIVWTPTNLDRWLTAPTLMVPGTLMGFRLGSPQDRADVITYLAKNPTRPAQASRP